MRLMESQKAFPNHLKQAFPNHLKKAFLKPLVPQNPLALGWPIAIALVAQDAWLDHWMLTCWHHLWRLRTFHCRCRAPSCSKCRADCCFHFLPAVVPFVEPQVVFVEPPRHLITAVVCAAEAETVDLAVVRSDHLIWPSVDNEVCDRLSHIELAAALCADCYHSLDLLLWPGVWLVWNIDWSRRLRVLFFGVFVLFWFLALVATC